MSISTQLPLRPVSSELLCRASLRLRQYLTTQRHIEGSSKYSRIPSQASIQSTPRFLVGQHLRAERQEEARGTYTHSSGSFIYFVAAIAQLGERQTEDLKVPGSIPGLGTSELHFRSISRLDMDELPSQPICSRRATVLCAVSCKVPRTDLFDSSVYVGLFVHVPRVSGPG